MTLLFRNCSLKTLEQIRDALAEEASFHVPSTVIEWLDEQIERREEALPPDPDGLNERRAMRFGHIIDLIADDSCAQEKLIDLLADAMHWCDANGEDFHIALAQACRHYIHELNDEQHDERRLQP